MSQPSSATAVAAASGLAVESKHEVDLLRAWLRAVGDIARLVNRDAPLSEVIDLIAETVRKLTGYESCAVFIAELDPPRLMIEGSAGLSADYVALVNNSPVFTDAGRPLSYSPSARAFQSRCAVVVDDIATDPNFRDWRDEAIREGLRSLLAMPLIVSGRALGVLTSYSATEGNFTPGDRARVEILADQAAIAIEAARLRAREKETIAGLEQLNSKLEEHLQLSTAAESVHRDLIATALDGGGLSEIVAAVSRHVGEDVRLYARDIPGMRSIKELDMDDPRTVRVPVVHEQSVAGYLVAENGDEESPASPLRRRALESAAWLVALEFQRQATAQEVWLRLSGDLLGDILRSSAPNEPLTIQRRAARLGHDLTKPHSVVVVRKDSVPESKDHHGAELELRRLVQIARGTFDRPDPRAVVGMVTDSVVALVPSDPGADSTNLREAAARIQRRFRERSRTETASVSIGATCEKLSEYPTAYAVAVRALEIQPGVEAIRSSADLGIYQFLLQISQPRQLGEFSEQLLGPLRTASRSDLLGTLKAYLANHMSVSRTAEDLVVHVNTVAYRIRRIEEILGLDLHDSEALLNVKFALMIDETVNRT